MVNNEVAVGSRYQPIIAYMYVENLATGFISVIIFIHTLFIFYQ